jgi:hypothetical protein
MGVPADRCMPVRHQLWMGNGLKINPLHQVCSLCSLSQFQV